MIAWNRRKMNASKYYIIYPTAIPKIGDRLLIMFPGMLLLLTPKNILRLNHVKANLLAKYVRGSLNIYERMLVGENKRHIHFENEVAA